MISTLKNSYQLSAIICLLFLFASCNNENTIEEGNAARQMDTLISKAARWADNKSPWHAVYFIDSAISGKELTVKARFKVYGFKCDIYHNQANDTARARMFADSMMLLIETNGTKQYSEEYALANYSKGDVLFKQGNYTEAYSYYYNARLIARNNLDSCTIGEYSFRLGMVLYRQSRYHEAAENFKQAFDETRTCIMDFGKFYRLQQLLNNTGLSFYRAGKPDSAITYYKKALNFIEQYGNAYSAQLNEVAKAVVKGNLANIYKEKGDLYTAKKLLHSSIAINSQKGYDNKDAQFSILKLADIMYLEKQPDSMWLLLRQASESLATIQNREAEMQWNRLMWKYYNYSGETKIAYQHLMRFTEMDDSTQLETNRLKSTDLSRQIRLLEDQYQIQELKKKNQVKDLTLIIFIITFILAIAIVWFVWQTLKRSRQHVAALRQLNERVYHQKQELEQTLAMVEQKNHEQDRILRIVAHDLRTPMAAISMLADVLQKTNDDVQRKEMIGLVKTSADNSLNLIKEIMDAATTNADNLETTSADINTLIHDCTTVLQFKAMEKQQNIIVELLPKPKELNIDQEKIWRVLANLITNAIKFSPSGSEIRVKAIEAGNKVTIAIADNGIGIPPDLQPKVFDMFTEAKRKGTAGEKPYGLGLSICKQIITAHGGKIWFDSKPNEGTTFYIELG